MSEELYISVDVETAGPIPGKYSLLAIGATVVGSTSQTFYVELRPISDDYVPEALHAIGRNFADFQQSGVEPLRAMSDFAQWITAVSVNRQQVFVGFNATFDWSFINWYFHTYTGGNPFGVSGIDIKAYYMGLAGCSWDETRSSRIPTRYKGASQHTHHALDDALEQAEMFFKMRNSTS